MGKKKARLAITVCATKSYLYAARSQARRVAANLEGWPPGLVVFVGDDSQKFKDAFEYWRAAFPPGWGFEPVADPAFSEHKNYKEAAQLVLARMRGAAFSAARKWGASFCWSLDSDVLPPANALECMAHMLKFDGGYYGVSTCSYPNEAFLGGAGSHRNPILPNHYADELELPDLVKNALKILDAKIEKAGPQDPETLGRVADPAPETPSALAARKARIEAWLQRRDYPPLGNVFELNAKSGWRPRGWLEHQYPGIGRGAVLPVDWCGFGCTLMGRKALAYAHFEGYEGKGTEDLWICFKRWRPEGIRVNCISHVVCDHVIHHQKKGGANGEYTHIQAYHEPDGDSAGHLRTQKVPWLYD